MEPTHRDTNASLKIFEMKKSSCYSEPKRDIANTPSDIDTMAPLLNTNTVIPSQPMSPFFPLMEEYHRRKSTALGAN